MNFVHLAARVFDTPLMIHRPHLTAIAEYLDARMRSGEPIDLESAISFEERYTREEADPVDAVAIIPIHGSLVHRGMGRLNALSGLRSYAGIAADFRKALGDGDISAIVFDVASGGGEVSGLFELAEEIYSARGVKPIFGFVNDTAASAAFTLISAVDPGRLFVGKASLTGSMGIIMVHRSQEEADKKRGLQYTEIFAGARKADGSPHRALEGEAREAIQATVDSMYGVMVDTIARNRGVDAQVIRDTEARVIVGMDAVTKGLADGASSFREVLAMAYDAQNERSIENMENGTTPATAATPNKAKTVDLSVIRAEAKAAAVEEERGRVKSIRGLSFAGAEDVIRAAIDDGTSVEDTKSNLISFVQKEGVAQGYLASRRADEESLPDVPSAEETVIPAKPVDNSAQSKADRLWNENKVTDGLSLHAEFGNDVEVFKTSLALEEKDAA